VKVTQVVPILNVSDVEASFAWFAKLGWSRTFAWCGPGSEVTDFGGVGCDGYEIFLCRDGQGGRGRGANERTGGPRADQRADQGAWVAIWVADVDEVHERCLAEGLEVTFPPTDEPWGVREMHVRHPDGHVFRVSTASG
jgi:catechol 2,3-dioxygenase-like lactoylglutathione lyase family enzyme